MNKKMRNRLQRENAQTMVEFALVFPLVLLIVYGLIECGRMLFIYSSTTSAAREGTRYGAAAGDVSGNMLPHYADCDGIMNATLRSGRFAGLTTDNVTISYDHGPNTDFPEAGQCPPYDGDGLDLINNVEPYYYDRIVVEVVTHYEPVINIPGISGFDIRSENARTILSNIRIVGTPPSPMPTFTTIPTRTLTPTPTYTFTPTLTGQPTPTQTLTPPLTQTPPIPPPPPVTHPPPVTAPPPPPPAAPLIPRAQTI